MDTPEELDSPLAARPELLATHLAMEKAVAAAEECASQPCDVVLAFDTIVVLDGEVLGKPLDVPDAWRMLRCLSGRTHQVVTGVAINRPSENEARSLAVTTNVRMKSLTDCQIEAWMAVGEFMGCAGAYNIEGQVAEVELDECYQNVAGLPLCHLWAELQAMQLPCALPRLTSPLGSCDRALARSCLLGRRVAGVDREQGET